MSLFQPFRKSRLISGIVLGASLFSSVAGANSCPTLLKPDEPLFTALPPRLQTILSRLDRRYVLMSTREDWLKLHKALDRSLADETLVNTTLGPLIAQIRVSRKVDKLVIEIESVFFNTLSFGQVATHREPPLAFADFLGAVTEWIALNRVKLGTESVELVGKSLVNHSLVKLLKSTGFHRKFTSGSCAGFIFVGGFLGLVAGTTPMIFEAKKGEPDEDDWLELKRGAAAVGVAALSMSLCPIAWKYSDYRLLMKVR